MPSTAAKRRESCRKWRLANKERVAKYNRQWSLANKELAFSYARTRRARKKNAPINDFTAAQWNLVKAHYNHRCIYCNKKPKRLTMDHITPLSKGGNHTMANIVPACLACNCRKQAGPVPFPVQPLLV